MKPPPSIDITSLLTSSEEALGQPYGRIVGYISRARTAAEPDEVRMCLASLAREAEGLATQAKVVAKGVNEAVNAMKAQEAA